MEHHTLSEDATGPWEITTAHGTRIVLDLPNRRWMRLPKMDDDGRLNLVESDGRWQRLAFVPTVEVGEPAFVHTSLSQWWRTTPVAAIRPLPIHQMPEPRPVAPDDLVEDEGRS